MATEKTTTNFDMAAMGRDVINATEAKGLSFPAAMAWGMDKYYAPKFTPDEAQKFVVGMKLTKGRKIGKTTVTDTLIGETINVLVLGPKVYNETAEAAKKATASKLVKATAGKITREWLKVRADGKSLKVAKDATVFETREQVELDRAAAISHRKGLGAAFAGLVIPSNVAMAMQTINAFDVTTAKAKVRKAPAAPVLVEEKPAEQPAA